MTKEALIAEADDLFDTIESELRSKMHQEFESSTSTTPGLWGRIESEYDPIFQRILTFKQNLETIIP